MGFAPTRLGRIAIKEQTGWGTAETSFSASDYVECEVVIPELKREAIQTDTIRGGYHESSILAGSKMGVEVSLSMPLHGWSAATPTADPTEHPDALLCKMALGSAVSDGYSEDLAGGTETTTVTVTTGVEDHYQQALLVPLAAGGRGVCWVTGVSGNDYFVTPLPSTAASSGTIHGSYVCSQTTDQLANGLTLDWLGGDATAAVRLFDGGVTSWSFDFSPKTQPKVSVGTRFIDWSLTGSGGAPAPYAYTHPQLPVSVGENGATLSINGVSLPIVAGKFSTTIELSEVSQLEAMQGVGRQVPTNRVTTLEVTTLPTDFSTLAKPGDAGGPIVLTLCTTPGRAVSVFMSTSVVKAQSTITAGGQLLAIKTVYGVDFDEFGLGALVAWL